MYNQKDYASASSYSAELSLYFDREMSYCCTVELGNS